MRKLIGATLMLLLFSTVSACGAPDSSGRGGGAAPTLPMITPSPSPAPLPAPTDAPASGYWDAYEKRAGLIMQGMSLEEKVWQMFMVRPDFLSDSAGEVSFGGDIREALRRYPVGGLIFSDSNLKSTEQISGMTGALQDSSEIPPLIAVDEEGGAVARVARVLGTTRFRPMYEYRLDGAVTAYKNAGVIARDIAALGFNLNLAPVADIWTNPANTVIGKRAYSDDGREASFLVRAAVIGYQENGVAACLKHFPGHGDTYEDTHDGSSYSRRTPEELRERELLPFVAGINAGADMVMMSHVTMTQIDPDNPSSLSVAVIADILRGELGFEGVVITDSLEMAALDELSSEQAAVRAVLAGNDILLGSRDPESDARAVMDSVPEKRVDESVMRILCLKLKYGIIS